MTSTHNRRKIKESLFVLRMLIIPLINLAVFFFYMNFDSVAMAFRIGDEPGFTLHNFKVFFNEFTAPDSDIKGALINSLLFFGTNLIIIFPISLLLSYFLYRRIWGYKIFRVVFFVPSIISAVAMVTVFKQFVNPGGPLNKIAQLFGNTNFPELLADSRYAKWTIILYCIWTGLSSNMIIFGGAMVRVPLELIESAKIDGSNVFSEFTHIVLPLIWPTISTLLTFTFVGIFTSGGPILLFTEGQFDTFTVPYWMYDRVKNVASYNYPSAVGLVLTVVAFPIVMLAKKIIDKIGCVIEY